MEHWQTPVVHDCGEEPMTEREESKARYEIRPDTNCWSIVKIRTTGENSKNPGSLVETAVSWHTTLRSAVNYLTEVYAQVNAEYLPFVLAIEKAKQQVYESVAHLEPSHD